MEDSHIQLALKSAEDARIQAGLKLMESHRRASAAYYERLREKKKDEGTYKKPGRPRKINIENTEKKV